MQGGPFSLTGISVKNHSRTIITLYCTFSFGAGCYIRPMLQQHWRINSARAGVRLGDMRAEQQRAERSQQHPTARNNVRIYLLPACLCAERMEIYSSSASQLAGKPRATHASWPTGISPSYVVRTPHTRLAGAFYARRPSTEQKKPWPWSQQGRLLSTAVPVAFSPPYE